MFSSLSQNSILYVWDFKNSPKILSGPIERVSIPRPKYTTFNPTMEMLVDITATINGERREFKDVPNTSVADFGDNAFVLAENKETLNSYITAKYQNAKAMIENAKKQEALLQLYEQSLEELNPSIKADKEKDKVIADLKDEMKELKYMIAALTKQENSKT
jgi:hypothetical protein